MACQCVVVEEYCEWNDVCDSLITWFCVVCCLFVIWINANVNEIVWMPDLLRPPVWVCGGNLCLPQLATSGLQYCEHGSPIVQQISRYGDTPKYADMVDRDIGDIYRHMSMSKCWINAARLSKSILYSENSIYTLPFLLYAAICILVNCQW